MPNYRGKLRGDWMLKHIAICYFVVPWGRHASPELDRDLFTTTARRSTSVMLQATGALFKSAFRPGAAACACPSIRFEADIKRIDNIEPACRGEGDVNERKSDRRARRQDLCGHVHRGRRHGPCEDTYRDAIGWAER